MCHSQRGGEIFDRLSGRSREDQPVKDPDRGGTVNRSSPRALEPRDWFDWGFLILPVLISPLLLFPRMEWMWVCLSVPVLWLADYAFTRRLLDRTCFNPLLLPLLLMVLVSLYATPDLPNSLAKVAGTLLGISVFFGIVRFVDRVSRWRALLAVFCAGGAALAFLSLIGTRWKSFVPLLEEIVSFFPTRLQGLPGAEEGFNPNAVGGTMILFVPLFFVLVWGREPIESRFGRCLVWGCLVVTTVVLALSQSRGAWLAFSCSCGVFLLLCGTRIQRILIVLVLLAGSLLLLTIVSTGGSFHSVEWDSTTLTSRVEIWERAVFGIQDFTFTGMGMNTFRVAVEMLYPLFSTSPARDIASAHNLILQAALDLGVPGLITYVGLWSALGRLLYLIWSQTSLTLVRRLVIGLGCGLLASLLFQMVDAIPIGAKVGIFFWIILGIAHSVTKVTNVSLSPALGFRSSRGGIVWIWALVSLLAIAFIGTRPYFGLAVATAAGILLGQLVVQNGSAYQDESQIGSSVAAGVELPSTPGTRNP